MSRGLVKRETDLNLISNWIEPGQSVLDLGCGRGILLEQLMQTRQVFGVGVDIDTDKVESCVKRGVSVYQGDAEELLPVFEQGQFDWVVLSRTVHELDRPARVIHEALRVGKRLAIGFANYGYWRNRVSAVRTGALPVNEVFPHPWYDERPHNPVTVTGFEAFCAAEGIEVLHRVYLRGDWRTRLTRWPALRAGYALYALQKRPGSTTASAGSEDTAGHAKLTSR